MSLKTQLVAFTLAFTAGTGLNSAIRVEAQSLASSDSSSVAFLCQVINGIPNTVARVIGKERPESRLPATAYIPVIEWNRPDYPDSNETPVGRCRRVSRILQYYGRKGNLDYISYGDMDGKQVICATTKESSPCSLLIFTLEKDENPKQIVSDLRQIIKNPTLIASNRNVVGKSGIYTRWQNSLTGNPRFTSGAATR